MSPSEAAVDFLHRHEGRAVTVGVSAEGFGLLETATGTLRAVQLQADWACVSIGDAGLVLNASLLQQSRVKREGLSTILVVNLGGDAKVTIYPEEPLGPGGDDPHGVREPRRPTAPTDEAGARAE